MGQEKVYEKEKERKKKYLEEAHSVGVRVVVEGRVVNLNDNIANSDLPRAGRDSKTMNLYVVAEKSVRVSEKMDSERA